MRQEHPSPGGLYPLIAGSIVVWTAEPHGGLTGGAPTDWSIKLYDIPTGALSLVTNIAPQAQNAPANIRQKSY